jgi:hypothetical protein
MTIGLMHWHHRIVSLPIFSSPPREQCRIMTFGNLDQAPSSQSFDVERRYPNSCIVGNPETIANLQASASQQPSS